MLVLSILFNYLNYKHMANIGIEFKSNMATMQFLNCKIDVPLNYGGQVIASGCGSGKTTIIKDIIRQKFNEGVLYTASTIKECNDMYDWCISELVDKNITLCGVQIRKQDIIVLHSKDAEGRMTLIQNPTEIANKLIVICTHYKFLHEYPEVLLKKSFDIRLWNSPGTGLRRSVTNTYSSNTKINSPRQWILIDELPTCDILNTKIEKPLMSILMKEINLSKYHMDESGNIVTDCIKVEYTKYPTYELMEDSYNRKAKGTSLSIRKGDTPIDQFRTRMPLEALYENFDVYNPECKIKDAIVRYNITDLLLDNINTRFWVFDGTGDLTFNGSIKFSVRKVSNRYSSPINFIKIPISSKRYLREEFIIRNEDSLINDLDSNCNDIISQIMKNKKTLIVTWKNLKVKGNVRLSALNLTCSGVNDEFNLTQYYVYIICNKLGIPIEYNIDGGIRTTKIKYLDKEFSFISYQSGLDKATNEFREYDSIVFYGKFLVPNSAIYEFNESYKCNVSHLNYTTYQLVQAVCRTRIRNHKGEPINIYFSEDWDENYMIYLNMYLTNTIGIEYITNTSDVNKLPSSTVIEDDTLSSVKNKWKPVIKKLIEWDKNILNSIKTLQRYEFIIDLDDIYNILPFNDRKVTRYYPLINYLRQFNIEMTIRTIRNKNKI